MLKSRILLKIGPLNGSAYRWLDALDFFSMIYVVLLKSNREKRLSDSRIKYIEFDDTKPFNRFLILVIKYLCEVLPLWINTDKKKSSILTKFSLKLLATFNAKWLNGWRGFFCDEVLVSYNDFDESGILFLLLKDRLSGDARITRAYKESRPGFNLVERESFRYADRLVFNHRGHYEFFEKKYGKDLFANKEILLDLDEDFCGKQAVINFSPLTKLSLSDGKLHVVILASKVFSDTSNKRSGARLCYISMIEEFLSVGLSVHLHTLKIYPDKNGVNQYEKLAYKNPNFIIEPPLDFNKTQEAMAILSRYDYGVMHNYIEGTSNSGFDKYNIPHRYYEYQIAEVIPLLKKNETVVLEDIISEKNTGCIYADCKEILNFNKSNITFCKQTFSEYIDALY